jgi:hypothetical protein
MYIPQSQHQLAYQWSKRDDFHFCEERELNYHETCPYPLWCNPAQGVSQPRNRQMRHQLN